MKKVVILVSTNILKIRIERLLPHFENIKVEFMSAHKLQVHQASAIFSDVSLVIIDLNHHEIDSIQTILELRRVNDHHKMPIIVFGNSADVALINKAVLSGCTDFILMPFEDETFIEKISKQLEAPPESLPLSQIQQVDIINEAHSPIQWNSNFRMGIEAIDNEHKMIIDSFAKLYELMKAGHGHEYYQELLLFLKNYVRFHFENEELFQQEMHYDQYEQHHRIHEGFKTKIEEIFEAHREQPVSNADLVKINMFVKSWLTHHILVEDRKFGDFYERTKNQ